LKIVNWLPLASGGGEDLRMAKSSYRNLIVWEKSMDLVEKVYRLTSDFPNREIFGLTQQLRRAVVSIPSNIAEGHGRQSDGDFLRFLRIAQGSLREVETQLLIAGRLDYLNEQASATLLTATEEVGRLLNGFSKSVQRDITKAGNR
jgi:four helix bundle protein